MRKGTSLTAYVDETDRSKFDHVKAYHIDKNPGVPMSDSAALITIIKEAYEKILGAQTNSNRITKIIEHIDILEATDAKIIERLNRLEVEIAELVQAVKSLLRVLAEKQL